MTNKKVRTYIQKRVESGRYNIGEPCLETIQICYKTKDGSVKREEKIINARQLSIRGIRESLLKKHEDMRIMRLLTNEEIKRLDRETVSARLKPIMKKFFRLIVRNIQETS